MNVKTITLNGEETKIVFENESFKCFWIQNTGKEVVYASCDPNIAPKADGVIAVMSGASASVFPSEFAERNTLYLLGSGEVQIVGCDSFTCPFKIPAYGGNSDEISPVFDIGLYCILKESEEL